jgi:molybdopterin molybdotransferase
VPRRGAPGADVQDTLHRLLAGARPLGTEAVPIWDAAGRIAADDVRAAVPVPNIARAAMDGYLCHDGDIAGAADEHPVRLRISGASVMGEPPGPGPAHGEAWSITTGAPVPRRGDRILPLETVRVDGTTLHLDRAAPPRRHIAEPGEEIRPGELLASRGDSLAPAACGALAAAGIAALTVYRRPRVALVATGNELVEVDAGGPAPPAGSIVNSNAVTLAGEIAASGCDVDYLGIVRDRRREMSRGFDSMRRRYDVVLSSGGVSVGRYDLVHRTWLDLGARRCAGRVDLKPGGPFFAGRAGRAWAIGLSGTPVACLAAYHLLVRPVLRRLAGAKHVVRPVETRVLANGWPRSTGRLRAVWGQVEDGGDEAVRLLTDPSAGRLALLAGANAVALFPAGTPPLPPGSRVAVLRLDRVEDRSELLIPAAAPGPLVVGVTGASGSGKTVAITGLIRRLAARGLRIASVKHAAHGFDVDHPDSDSARMVAAGAIRVVLSGPTETAVRITGELPLLSLIRAASADGEDVAPDLVFVEGFGAAGYPIIQIGPPKSDAPPGEPWHTLPALAALPQSDRDRALEDVEARILARLKSVPAAR